MSRPDSALPVPFNLPPHELLHYLPTHRVLVCKLCQYAIQPAAIPRHLKDLHHIYRSSRRPFVEYASNFDLADPQDVILPRPHELPVPLLPVEDGVACEAEECEHLCVTVKRMKSHWTTVHHQPGQEGRSWRRVKLQTFFRGNQLQYFEVSEVMTPPADQEVSPGHTASINYREPEHDASSSGSSSPVSIEPPQLQSGEELTTAMLSAGDRELLHHFTTSTYATMACNPGADQVWQVTAPTIAMKQPFLLHGILACAALHLASLHPQHRESYLFTAAQHQDQALSGFRQVVSVPVTEENGDAVYAFTNLLVVYVFASEDFDNSLLLVNGDEGLPQWLNFIRNGCAMLGPVWMNVATGPMRVLISKAQATLECVTDVMAWEAIEYDPRPLLSFIPPFESEFAWSEKDCMTYFKAAIELGKAFSCVDDMATTMSTWDAMHMWPMRLTDDFMLLLKDWHPAALILMAHYCVLLKGLENHWFFCNRSARMIRTIYSRLDENLRWTLVWPMQQCGVTI
ncbi:hypothetical protein PVAG01_08651 [Phlyctema vagabunda]|uniref:C2H2-type domain-containing protein n=1 Tax=Phlyctema vagabunda TaxID=108571 RepID=A0ABR4PA09_9HELO